MKESPEKPLEDLLKGLIKDLKEKGLLTEEEVRAAWEGAAGKKAATHTRPTSLRKSVLAVTVDGSSWLYELTLKKKEILKRLEGKFKKKKVEDIRFRIGVIK